MRIKVEISIDYDEATLEGFDVESHLEGALHSFVSNGGLTGESEAIVDQYALAVYTEW